MSHELDFTTGRAAIAFAGQVPWHGFGTEMTPGMTADEWRKASGLDFEVYTRPVFYGVEKEGARIPVVIPGRQALLRDDTDGFLSIVSTDYKIHQPSKIFQFFTDLAAHLDIQLEVCGALDGGRKIWALGRIGDSCTIFGQDTINPYVLMATSFDGTLSTTAMYTSVRVVCKNTLGFSGAFDADAARSDVYKVRHNQEFVIRDAHGKLGLDEEAWLEYKRNMENLARFQISPEDALEYFYTVAGQADGIERNEDNGEIIAFPEPGRVVKQYINAYHNGPGANFASAKGTMFGALNAVTFYQDHLAPAGDRGKRFNSATFGGGNVRKKHAAELALAKFNDANLAVA